MSKITLTHKQAVELKKEYMQYSTVEGEMGAVLRAAERMGLVRPVSDDPIALCSVWAGSERYMAKMKGNEIVGYDDLDRTKEVVCQHQNKLNDLAARVAALEAAREKDQYAIGNLSNNIAALQLRVAALEVRRERAEIAATREDSDRRTAIEAMTPDPHAAAKERAKLWGVELVTLKDGTCLFMTEKHYLSNPKPSWFPHVFSFRSPHYSGGHKTPSEAWSNFPTEPPPGWEAPKDNGFGDNDSWTGPAEPKPRTEADRLEVLGEVAYEADRIEGSGPWSSLSDKGRESWRKKALAVRKADRAAQLEPSEEEVKAALLCWRETLSTVAEMKDILAAAARVRLEKAEGEAS